MEAESKVPRRWGAKVTPALTGSGKGQWRYEYVDVLRQVWSDWTGKQPDPLAYRKWGVTVSEWLGVTLAGDT